MQARPPRGAALLALLLASPVAAADWGRLDRMRDVRYDVITDLSDAARRDEAVLALSPPLLIDGRVYRSALVGPGHLLLEPEPHGADRAQALRLDIFSGSGVRFGPDTRVVATSVAGGVALRFVALETARGDVTVEAILRSPGDIQLQYLRLPVGAATLGEAGWEGTRLMPATASSWRLELESPVRLPVSLGGNPPPPSCSGGDPTWCDLADGPGESPLLLDENFDDGASVSRGWSASGSWVESRDVTCQQGARGIGGAWYFGDPIECLYPDRSMGDLVSPATGLLGPRAELRFSSRLDTQLGRDGLPADTAEILVDGIPVASLPGSVDPAHWNQFLMSLSPWSGSSVRIGFRFTSDQRERREGWYVDDVIVADPDAGQPACRMNAGRLGATPCSERAASEWRFNEGRYCEGCTYTFYVLVECGREMHLPLHDMEGADVRVTNLLDPGATPRLRCVNDTAKGRPSAMTLRDAGGRDLDCCAIDGPESWWGPAFDATDSEGPGHVAWGLSEGCPVQDILDADRNGLTCDELPPTCGGLIAGLSPGEEQVMDCFISDEGGLCGLYRVDIVSGGHAWRLVANCDGSPEPQFPIFFDCTDAWAAFAPLPELSLARVDLGSACTAPLVDIEVLNVGCADVDGDIPMRLELEGVAATCDSPVMEALLPGPLRRGESRILRVTLPSGCAPSSVRALLDPGNTILECSEAGGASACSPEPGSHVLPASGCPCAGGAPAGAVRGQRMRRLDGMLEMTWEPSVGAASYRVARGVLGAWYSHVVDSGLGAGACDTQGLTLHSDPDDLALGGSFYYLVEPLDACGIAGEPGIDSLGRRQPPAWRVGDCS